LCAASICHDDDSLVVAYLDGSLRIWNLSNGCFGLDLKEKYTSDEDIITGICTQVCLSKNLCVATFQNGKIRFKRNIANKCFVVLTEKQEYCQGRHSKFIP